MSTIVELTNRLRGLEATATALRQDVSALEATHNSLSMSESTADRAIELRKQRAEGDSRTSSKRRARGRVTLPPGHLPPPQDFVDMLVQKAGEVNAAVEKRRELQRNKEVSLALLENAVRKLEDAERDYADLLAMVDVDENGRSKVIVGMRKQNNYVSTLKELTELYRQRDLLQGQLRNQNDELRRLASLLEGTTNAAAQKEEAQTVLAQKQQDLQAMTAQRGKLERLVNMKYFLSQRKPTGLTEDEKIRSANYDRNVAFSSMEKSNEEIKRNDLAIRHRAVQIAKLEKRLELIGDAVAGDDFTEEARPDVEQLVALQDEIAKLAKEQRETNVQMDMLDAEVENLEYKLCACKHTARTTRREMAKVEQAHARYINLIKKELGEEHTANKPAITGLEEEIEELEAAVAKKRNGRAARHNRKRATGMATA